MQYTITIVSINYNDSILTPIFSTPHFKFSNNLFNFALSSNMLLPR